MVRTLSKRLSVLEELLLLIEERIHHRRLQAMQLFSSSEIQYGMKQILGESLQGGRTRNNSCSFACSSNKQLFSVCDEAKSESII